MSRVVDWYSVRDMAVSGSFDIVTFENMDRNLRKQGRVAVD